jgi:hypothetical protein
MFSRTFLKCHQDDVVICRAQEIDNAQPAAFATPFRLPAQLTAPTGTGDHLACFRVLKEEMLQRLEFLIIQIPFADLLKTWQFDNVNTK